MRKLAVLTGLFLAAFLAASGAEARKVALVIGNDRYAHLESLQKAAADAAGYADVLHAKGFDQVTLKQNLTRDQMDEAIADFVAAIGQGDVAVFVYSGHGWSNGSQNFIIGTDAPDTASEERLARIAIPVANGLNGIVDEMTRKGASLKVAIVDACRNNPFRPQSGGKAVGFGRGFNRLKEPPPDGTFMVFSAGAGQVALDRLSDTDADPHGVFTRTFLPLLRTDLTLLDATKAAQEHVFELAKAIGHDQLPAYYDEVKGKACLAGTCEGPATPLPPPGGQYSPELLFWTSIMNSDKAGDYRAYLEQYPAGSFATLAKSRLAALEPGAPVKPLAAPAPIVSAECPEGAVASVGNAGVAEAVTRCLKPGETFTDCSGCPEMVVIPAGRFVMGSPAEDRERARNEFPRHEVTIARAYAIGRFEVTRAQFAAFVNETAYAAASNCQLMRSEVIFKGKATGSWRKTGFTQADNHPVTCLAWADANAYVEWLARKTGQSYRLPTEAEWERAARGGTTTRFYFGEEEKGLCGAVNGLDRTATRTIRGDYSNITAMPCNDGFAFTGPVGSYPPNPYGLHDATGNAAEWVADCYHDNFIGAPGDGSAWVDYTCDDLHVIKGGSWVYSPFWFTVAERDHTGGKVGGTDGFRVARSLSP